MFFWVQTSKEYDSYDKKRFSHFFLCETKSTKAAARNFSLPSRANSGVQKKAYHRSPVCSHSSAVCTNCVCWGNEPENNNKKIKSWIKRHASYRRLLKASAMFTCQARRQNILITVWQTGCIMMPNSLTRLTRYKTGLFSYLWTSHFIFSCTAIAQSKNFCCVPH